MAEKAAETEETVAEVTAETVPEEMAENVTDGRETEDEDGRDRGGGGKFERFSLQGGTHRKC